jgi:hypothetical protein
MGERAANKAFVVLLQKSRKKERTKNTYGLETQKDCEGRGHRNIRGQELTGDHLSTSLNPTKSTYRSNSKKGRECEFLSESY